MFVIFVLGLAAFVGVVKYIEDQTSSCIFKIKAFVIEGKGHVVA
jgi:cell division septal protein FtsQ